MVKIIEIEIEGIRPLLQHQMVQNEEVKRLVDTLQKNSDDIKCHERLAEISTYRKKDGTLYLPSEYFETSFVKAGSSKKIPGRGNTTYKDVMKGQISIDPLEIIITPQSYEVFYKYVKIGKARILRARPQFPAGWKATFKVNILDDTTSLSTIKELIDYAGMYIGIGDWRPKFGLFKVNSFKEI
jgi:hypothetical protein